jgi:hypothetical protein
MTILSQAETIRDETLPSANTASRVGTCLVDIADQLAAILNKAIGNLYMVGNATVTVVSNTSSFFKIAGTTVANTGINNDFSASGNNRLVYDGTATKTFKIGAVATVLCGHGSHTVEIGIYNSASAAVDTNTVGRTMIQAGASKPTQVCCEYLAELSTDDYVEVHLKGVDSAESYTVTNLNLTATEV